MEMAAGEVGQEHRLNILPAMNGPSHAGRRAPDPVALARTLQRLHAAAEPPWLHGEVARRMAERLPLIRRQPEVIAEWGAFLGASHARLREAYPAARLLAVEAAEPQRASAAQRFAAPWWAPRRWRGRDEALLPAQLPPGQAQLLWSNMGLHFAGDPPAEFAAWQRALAVDGFLMFSTLGPGTLAALRGLYAQAGWGEAFAPFVDMHDLGDLLVEAGFAEPVMDQETVTLTWATPEAALAELRGLGANTSAARAAGLRTPRWRQRLLEGLRASADAQGRVALGFEVVYGHAFKAAPRLRVAAETSVAVEDLRAMARRGSGNGPAGRG